LLILAITAVVVHGLEGSNIVQSRKSAKNEHEHTEDLWNQALKESSPKIAEKLVAERKALEAFWEKHQYDDPAEMEATVLEFYGGKIPVHPNDAHLVNDGRMKPKITAHMMMQALKHKENPDAMEVQGSDGGAGGIPGEDNCWNFCDRHCNDVICDNWPSKYYASTIPSQLPRWSCGLTKNPYIYSSVIPSYNTWTRSFFQCYNLCGVIASHESASDPAALQLGINYCIDLESYYGCCGSWCCGPPSSQA